MKKVLFALCLTAVMGNANAGAVFSSSSYSSGIVFKDSLAQTTMTLAYDGTNYWSASGGSSSGVRYAQYDAAGNPVATYSPGIDFRSVFTDASGSVYARGYNNPTIYLQTAPGSFTSMLALSGGTLNSQSSVVMNGNGEFVAMNNGFVNVWDASGNISSSFSLSGFSGAYPNNRGIAVADDYLFTYNNQTLSAWDYSGTLLDQTTLVGAGTSFDSHFSLSYANDHIFIVDQAGGSWRGFDIGLTSTPSVPVPEPATLALFAFGLAGLGFSYRRKTG